LEKSQVWRMITERKEWFKEWIYRERSKEQKPKQKPAKNFGVQVRRGFIRRERSYMWNADNEIMLDWSIHTVCRIGGSQVPCWALNDNFIRKDKWKPLGIP
jgi:hypothetical protein